ncbi:alanine:cation symporter family protein, partial [Streptococcus mutans]|nr:alanine:cation symporter family protein [Streptococcus mutans]
MIAFLLLVSTCSPFFFINFKLIFAEDKGEGDISSFAALATALAATVGTGNIVGVA